MPRRRRFRHTREAEIFIAMVLGCIAIGIYIDCQNLTAEARLRIYLGMFVVAVPVVFFLVWREGRRKGRGARGCCLNCGYDLRASRWRCPECGTIPTPSKRPLQP